MVSSLGTIKQLIEQLPVLNSYSLVRLDSVYKTVKPPH